MGKTLTTAGPGIYCRKCSYDLRGQVEHRCPECGTGYDPAKAKTFTRKPRSAIGKWIKRAVIGLAIVALLAAAPFAWLYYGWWREQPVVERVTRLGDSVGYGCVEVPFLPRLVPERHRWILARVNYIGDATGRMTVEDLKALAPCRVKVLATHDRSINDSSIHVLCGMKDLSMLCVDGASDASVARLLRCRQLQSIYLSNSTLSDAGLAELCRLTELRGIWIASPALTDAGLESLTKLSKLDALVLDAAQIGDNGLAAVPRLSSLRFLFMQSGRYTNAGEKRLRQALPNCQIIMNPSSLAATTPSTAPSQ